MKKFIQFKKSGEKSIVLAENVTMKELLIANGIYTQKRIDNPAISSITFHDHKINEFENIKNTEK